jgi:hypothetical protein
MNRYVSESLDHSSRAHEGRKEHRVPLSTAALVCIERVRALRLAGDYVLPGNRKGKPLSNMAMLKQLERMERAELTVHGFRSTFHDWASERTNPPNEVIEMALAHAIEDKTEAVYHRGDLFEKRCRLMEAWDVLCAGKAMDGAVVPRRGAARCPASRYWPESSNLARMHGRGILALAVGLLLGQCSSTPTQMTAENVSPISYRSYACPELAQAALDLSSKASEVPPVEDGKWTSVKSFFGVRSENPEAARLAQLNGQLKAIEQVRAEKRC